MKKTLMVFVNTILGGVAGYAISTGREKEGIVLFCMIVLIIIFGAN